jgi:hypothetical protein
MTDTASGRSKYTEWIAESDWRSVWEVLGSMLGQGTNYSPPQSPSPTSQMQHLD